MDTNTPAWNTPRNSIPRIFAGASRGVRPWGDRPVPPGGPTFRRRSFLVTAFAHRSGDARLLSPGYECLGRGTSVLVPGYEGIPGYEDISAGERVLVPGYEGIPGYEDISAGERVLVPGYEGISAWVRGY